MGESRLSSLALMHIKYDMPVDLDEIVNLFQVWVQMNVVPRSTGNTNNGTRELTLKCKLKCYFILNP